MRGILGLICLLGIFFSAGNSQKCETKIPKRYFVAEWSADRLDLLSKGDTTMDLYFRMGQDGMEPIVDLEIYAATEEEANKYDFVILNGTGPFIESATIKRAIDSSANQLGSNMFIGTAAAIASAVALNNEEYHPVISYGIPIAMMATAAFAECEVSAVLSITLAPADFEATWLAYNQSYFMTDAASVHFVNKEAAPSTTDCSDPIVSVAFPITCAGVPPRTEAIIENQPLLLDNVFKFYNGAKFPHQECSLNILQKAIEAKSYFKTFSCQFRNQASDGSYCGSILVLKNVPASYNPTSSSHQKTAVDNLQRAVEADVTVWRTFQAHWRKERLCPTWEIRSDGRCGSNYGNAGCSPDNNFCCSTGGWCGSTSAHCTGGTDYRNGLPTSAPAKQTVRGPACNNNEPGVCIDETVCANAGGTSKSGFCPGAANIKCCGGPNVIAQVVKVISGRKCSGNHPETQTPGVCITASACTAAGGVTAKGLCPYDGADILCCNGDNVLVEYEVSGKSCGNYASSEVSKIQGNGGVIYDVVKVLQSHLVDSSAFYSSPTQRDNTMEVTTACNFDKMRTAALNDGVNIRIASAFRTYARQEYFWNCYQCGCCNGGNLAARPGTSNHGRGRALDLNTDCGGQYGSRPSCGGSRVYEWLYNNAQRFGFVRTVQSEPWHWEYIPGEPRAWYS